MAGIEASILYMRVCSCPRTCVSVCVCVRVRVCVWLYNCVLLQNTRGMSDDNDVCVCGCITVCSICMYA